MRNINEEDWAYFKTEAAKSGLSLGSFFSVVLKTHKEVKAADPWKEILHGKRIFTERELCGIKARCADFRKRFRFR